MESRGIRKRRNATKAATTRSRARRFRRLPTRQPCPSFGAEGEESPRPRNSRGERPPPSRAPLLIHSALHVLGNTSPPTLSATPRLPSCSSARRRRGTCEGTRSCAAKAHLGAAAGRSPSPLMLSSAAPPRSPLLAACAPSPAEKLRLDPLPDRGSRSALEELPLLLLAPPPPFL